MSSEGMGIDEESVDSSSIDDISIDDANIADGSVTNVNIDNKIVNDVNIDDGSLNEESINEESVNDESVNDESVNEESINDESIDDGSINDGVIDDEIIADGGIDDNLNEAQPTDESDDPVDADPTDEVDLDALLERELQRGAVDNPNLPGRLTVVNIEVENFKSYQGVNTIGPLHKGFSCVIGANGSGKSNVIDSMLFVFGYRAQRIRGRKMATLIHNSANHEGASSCRVTIFFQRIEDQGTDRDAFTVIPDSAFTISRIAYKNGSSCYRMDARECKFADVKKRLLEHNVNVDSSRFLILQGEVEHISIMKPKGQNEHEVGLLEFLEDLIGTRRYEVPLQMLIDKCENLSDVKVEKVNLESIEAVKSEPNRNNVIARPTQVGKRMAITRFELLVNISDRLEISYKKPDIADRHNRVRAAEKERNELKIRRDKAVEYLEFENDILRNNKDLENKNGNAITEYDAAKTELDQFEINVKTLEDELTGRKEAMNKLEKKIAWNTRRCEELRKLFNEIEDNESTDKKTLENNQKLLSELVSETQKDKLKVEELSRNIEYNPDKLNELKQEISEKEKLLREQEQKLAVSENEAQVETKELRDQMEIVRNEQLSIVDQRNSLKSEYEHVLSVRSSMEGDIKQAQDELKCAQSELETAREALPDLKRKLATNEKSLSVLSSSETELSAKLMRIVKDEGTKREDLIRCRKDIKEITDRRSKIQYRTRVLDFLMERRDRGELQGFYGRLGDLGYVDPQYDCAVSTAGGRVLDYIVVDTMDTAQHCVELMKRANVGSASFLGLNKQQTWIPHMNKKLNIPDNIPRIFDLIQPSSDEFKPAFYFAFRDTLVASNLDQASKVAYGRNRFRVVTTSGQLIEMSGTLSGGGKPIKGKIRTQKLSSHNISFSGEANDLKNLQTTCDQLQQSHDECRKEMESVRQQLNSVKSQVSSLSSMVDSLRYEIEDKKAAIEINSVRVERAQMRCNQLGSGKMTGVTLDKSIADKKADQLACLQFMIDHINAKIADIVNILCINILAECQMRNRALRTHNVLVFHLVCLYLAYEKISNSYDMLTARVQSINEQIEEEMDKRLQQQRSIVQNGRSQIKQQTTMMTKLENEIQTSKRNLNKLKTKIEKNEQRKIEMTSSMKTLSERLYELSERSGQLHAEYEECKLSISSLSLERQALSKEAKLVENQILQTRKSNIDMRETVEKLEKQVGDCKRKLKSLTSERSSLKLNDICEGYHVKPFDPNPDLGNVNVSKLAKTIDEQQKKHNQTKPNLNSIEDFEIKNKAYIERRKELDELMSKLRSLQEKHEILRKRREDEFMEAFNVIAKAVKSIYRELTLGGDADLELVDSLDPFAEGVEFSVRPPQKSWKRISNVSGGEKTLSSLALIFALHEYKPAPLYFMDEVDAALDFRNVAIIADFIRDRTLSAQFVVISLRLDMQDVADYMIGVYKQHNLSRSICIQPKWFRYDKLKDASMHEASGYSSGSSLDAPNGAVNGNFELNGDISGHNEETLARQSLVCSTPILLVERTENTATASQQNL